MIQVRHWPPAYLKAEGTTLVLTHVENKTSIVMSRAEAIAVRDALTLKINQASAEEVQWQSPTGSLERSSQPSLPCATASIDARSCKV